jgi:succinate dehydrogenase/fumarate reductase flavoprotein subunit
MDEYEKLEEELQRTYDEYMLKFRNQTYLENILDEYQKAELDANEVSLTLCSPFVLRITFFDAMNSCHIILIS